MDEFSSLPGHSLWDAPVANFRNSLLTMLSTDNIFAYSNNNAGKIYVHEVSFASN